MSELVLGFALIAVVLTVTALASGIVERSPLSFPFAFIALGLALGQSGLGVVELGARDQVLEIVATFTLSLVLFLDAVKLQLSELGRRWTVPALVLGPGTALIIALGAVPIALLFGFPWVLAFIGGAVLASTDPVVLRELVRDVRVPRSVRQALQFEAGLNDIVVLPVVLVLIAVANREVDRAGEWAVFLAKLVILGPAIGLVIGGLGGWLMTRADAKFGIRREHQALYGIGMVLGAYSAAAAMGGDGFLGAFFAGLAVVLLNQQLCDCFLEYGEVTAEMSMLLAFVLFGVVISGILGSVDIWRGLGLAALVLLVIRPSVLGLVLLRARISWEARAFISWFGPRGLNSLLLTLLVVRADVVEADGLLGAVAVVVLASVTVHGATATPISAWYGRRTESGETLAEEREGTAAGLFEHEEQGARRISPKELNELMKGPDPPVVLDVRSRARYRADDGRIPGSLRVLPDRVVEWAQEARGDALLVAY